MPVNDALVKRALDRFKLCQEAESVIRKDALDDIRFYTGDQWPASIRGQRELEQRPCLTVNTLKQFVNMVSNDIRQARRAAKITPVDDKADVETAKVIQGLVRHVERNSEAGVAYETAGGSAVKCGFGWWYLTNEYESPRSFDQEVKIKAVWNSFSIFLDPVAELPCGENAGFGFIVENMTEAAYKEKYSKTGELAGLAWNSLGDKAPGWITKDSCRIATYYEREFVADENLLLDTGESILGTEYEKLLAKYLRLGQMAPWKVVKKRPTQIPKVTRYVLNGLETLETTNWPGSQVPIIRVLGDAEIVDGELKLMGLIHDAKDSVRMHNYMVSAEAEAIALAPKAPFIAAEGQIAGREKEWENANQRAQSVLQYKIVDVGGNKPLPPPQRSFAEPAIQAISQARIASREDIKGSIGLYDPSLGQRSNETSGRAIEARQKQGSAVTYHFGDNLSRSIRYSTRQIVEVIPKFYDRAGRVQRIIGEDDSQRTVVLNKEFDEGGKKKIFDLNVGKYDTSIDTGPSWATQRQEAVDAMMQLVQAYPQLVEVVGDLMVKNMDWPGAQQIAERLKKMVPPQLQDQPEGQQSQVPPQVQAQLQQLVQQVEQLSQALDQATQQLGTKQAEIEAKGAIEKMKIESDERIARIDRQTRFQLEQLKSSTALMQTQAQLASREATEEIRHDLAVIMKQVEVMIASGQREFESQEAAAQRDHELTVRQPRQNT